MRRWIYLSIAIVCSVPILSFAAQTEQDAYQELRRRLERTPYSAQEQRVLMAKSRLAMERGIASGDVMAVVREGSARGMDARYLERFLTMAIETEQEGLPSRPVLNKIQQGIAKGIPEQRIYDVALRTRDVVKSAGEVVDSVAQDKTRPEAPGERRRGIESVSVAFEAGIPAREITELGQKAVEKGLPFSRFARVIESLSNLREAGMPPDLAVRTARRLVILNYSEKGIARTEQEFLIMRKNGMSWQEAFTRMQSGAEQGLHGRNRGPMHGSGAGGGAGFRGGHGKGGK